jgi:EAL and modified HD-GYP domain-containing signal transduction protein
MQKYTARQPIFDREKNVIAYELLYRNSQVNAFPSDVPADMATSSMLVNTFLDTNVGLITEGELAFINFSEKTILNDFTSIAPSGDIVIEILESVKPTDEMYEAFKSLHARKYTIAMDDFTFDPKWNRFLEFVSIIKIDVQCHSLDTVQSKISSLDTHFSGKFLAEKIETYDEYRKAAKLNFSYFQGYFFCKPEVISNKSVDYSNCLLMKIYIETLNDNPNIKNIERYLQQDVGLSSRLFRYVRNIFPNTELIIASINEALNSLGVDLIRKFTLILISSELSVDKPSELLKTSVYRAKFCELMLNKSPFHELSGRGFLAGLFSTLDAAMDMEIEFVMEQLPIDKDIKLALTQDVGLLAGILNILKFYESGDWNNAYLYCKQIGLTLDILHTTYKDSIIWQKNEINRLTT